MYFTWVFTCMLLYTYILYTANLLTILWPHSDTTSLYSIQGSVPTTQTQCCVDPDIWRAKKLDPARELNKRISRHSTDWLTWGPRGVLRPNCGLSQCQGIYTDDCVCLEREFPFSRYAELSLLLFESTFLHTYLGNMRQLRCITMSSSQNIHWCENTVQIMA